MMWSQYPFILSCLVVTCRSLTNVEETAFTNGVTVDTSGTSDYKIESTGIPEHTYGPFPADCNPNNVTSQNHVFYVPKVPEIASTPNCLGMGAIGVAYNGVPVFNPMNAEGENAGVVEVFDDCNGHPAPNGDYHYHLHPNCLVMEGEADKFMGVAMDGWPIYGPYDSNGEVITASMLDECNGWYLNDDLNQYQYRMTLDFPYIMGCYKGIPVNVEAPSSRCIFTADYDGTGDEPSCVPGEDSGNGQGGSDQGGNGQGGSDQGGSDQGGSDQGGSGQGGSGQGGSGKGGSGKGGSGKGGSGKGGSGKGGSGQGGSGKGGNAKGGNAEGGNAKGGNAEGGNAKGGSGGAKGGKRKENGLEIRLQEILKALEED